MTSRLDISVPATLTVLAGNGLVSSLGVLPPGGVAVADSDSTGRLTVLVVAGAAGAALTASGLGGATVGSSGQTLSLSGTAAQVNAALATLELTEPAGTASDILTVAASDPAVLPAVTHLAVAVVPQTGPAFVAPPAAVTLRPDLPANLGFLRLADPVASGLAAMGLGQSETLRMTLAVSAGILLMPGFTDAAGLGATGLGTGRIELDFTADELPEVNSLLSGMVFAGLAGGAELSYAVRNLSGPLPTLLTYGDFFLDVAGAPAGEAAYIEGSQTLIVGSTFLTGTAAITGTLAVLGNIAGSGALGIAPDASVQLPHDSLALGGTSLDFGTLASGALRETGTLIIGQGASLGGPLHLGTGALLDFSGLLITGGADMVDDERDISLSAGAVLVGSGALSAGNFSESGLIQGPGTLLVQAGQTLVVAAGSVTGGAHLDAAPGSVMLLGPEVPLYGIFDATPLTIDNSVTLTFLGNAGGSAVTGIYADTLGGDGAAFVIDGPQAFSGTVIGFAPGDQLIFPGLSDFSLLNITPGSFTVAGMDDSGSTVSYVIFASIAAGGTIGTGFDAEGDPDVFVRPTAATLFPAYETFMASAGIAQPLPGLSLQLAAAASQSLTVTLSASHGTLSGGTLGPASRITLTAPNIAALNGALGNLSYTGTGTLDALTISSATGILSGLLGYAALSVASTGTVSGAANSIFSEGQTASFAPAGAVAIISAPVAAGALLVAGTTDFASLVEPAGISGTALRIDDNAAAIFNAAANVALGGDTTLGDASGAGTLAILTQSFSSSGDLTLSGTGSALDILGTLRLAGALNSGAGASAAIALGGGLAEQSLTLGPTAGFFAYGTASAVLGTVQDGGTLTLDGAARATAAGLTVSNGLALGGTASLAVTGPATFSGTALINQGATLAALTLTQPQGTLTDAGILAATLLTANGVLNLAGGTLATPSLALGGVLEGSGIVTASHITGAGTLVAQAGRLILGGAVATTGPIEIAAGAALEIAGTIAAPVTFLGPDALLTLDDPAHPFPGAANMTGHDAIDLVGVTPSLASYANGTLAIADTLGSLIASFGIQTAPGQPAISIVSDNAGGALITLGDELPCFARGTRLLTPHGYRAVETLRPNDPLITASGISRPVRWIGRRTLDLGPHAARFALPILITPGAFGPGLPARALRLSPLHSIYADGVLIPVTHLVNGATILRESTTQAMTYFHIELDRHDILLAEGLPAESYFDSGNRGALYQEIGRRCPARRMFAPLVTTGPRLAKTRRRLHQAALAAGFSLTYRPTLSAHAQGQTLHPAISLAGHRRIACFRLPAAIRDLTLHSATATPADTDPDSEDRRELGICLEPAPNLTLGPGFHPRAPGDLGAWMGRTAALHLHAPERDLTLSLAAIIQSWVHPKLDVRPAAR